MFAGTSESDQLFKVVAALGAPRASDWPSAAALAAAHGVRFPEMARTGMAERYRGDRSDARLGPCAQVRGVP